MLGRAGQVDEHAGVDEGMGGDDLGPVAQKTAVGRVVEKIKDDIQTKNAIIRGNIDTVTTQHDHHHPHCA